MKRFLLIAVCLMLASGCSTITKVYPPDYKPDFTFQGPSFAPPAPPQKVSFVAKDGKKSQTTDNVTVEVADISPVGDEPEYSVIIKDPYDKEYRYTLFPMMLKVKITNRTDHIITLKQTIVKLEDESQNDYPMISNLSESKQKLVTKLSKSYGDFMRDIQQDGPKQFEKQFNNEYPDHWNKFTADLKAALDKGKVASPGMPEGYFLTDYGYKGFVDEYRPKTYYSKLLNSKIQPKFTTLIQKASKNMQDAIGSISQNISDNQKNIITSGVYQPISIIPGRSETVVIPFSTRKESETIKSVHIGIFDLPTKVDDAGNPLKRAHFNFEMVATGSN